ncbi:WD40-repeat-containing domain protein [Lophiotrema nucula]|uniref:GPI inositol-deacylase n=1 Tax=Lophiotrema nucula TaxID=690887 RepID=A0A6A5YFV2_9PLEO|nr:WD40-repeat-containing domain protein [Lophiotrema nucula]
MEHRAPAPGSTSFFGRKFRGFNSRRASSPPPDSAKENPYGLNTLIVPKHVVADLVFVHGLGGGSVSTWTMSQDMDNFWPQKWLPKDPEFQHVQIHSFGYNASWSKRQKNPLDVHSFGQSLIEELQSNPNLTSAPRPIVLVGHSMGGLVVKKACIISKQNPAYQGLASRLHSIFFLGTPHRGASLALTLGKILKICHGGSKGFVSNLETGSEAVRVLNDEFRLHYKGIHLHSFTESKPMNLGYTQELIVDAESATLGYAEERVQALNANHRDLCRFESDTNTDYRSLRNRLAATIGMIKAGGASTWQQSLADSGTIHKKKMRKIYEYLKVDQSAEDILSSLDERRLEGSCQWLTQRDTFKDWQFSDCPRYFWLKGMPATGKSVMSSHVIDYLRDSPCCFHFFKHGETSTSSVSVFLRSMAYQMARTNEEIREALLELVQQGTPLDDKDFRNVWRIVFLGCVFLPRLNRTHFWIIDALDEAVDSQGPEVYFSLFSKIDKQIPLKIFITSRPSTDLEGLFMRLPVTVDQISTSDSAPDICRFVGQWAENLPVAESTRDDFIKMIVDKSAGNFLWTSLVMKQLQEANTDEEVRDIFAEVPEEIEALYLRNIVKMEKAKSKSLVKTILTWTLCAQRPLLIDEMKDAIQLSLSRTISRDLRTSLDTICGQFVDVDQQSRVRVVHETARSFLLNPDLDSEFRIQSSVGHVQIARACLKYLLGLKSPKRPSIAGLNDSQNIKSSIANYACLHLFEHLSKATSSSDELFRDLVEFFDSAVLQWIENIAQLKELGCLVRASGHLTNYLKRRGQHLPLAPGTLNSWALDLPRIVTQFGVNLLSCPFAIYTLIPPFCPRNSAIFQRYAGVNARIKLRGLSDTSWSDRISCISYRDTMATAIACMDQRFAVGLADGSIHLYYTTTCEYLLTMHHGESIRLLQFGAVAKLLAAAGLKTVKLWDTSNGQQIFSIDTKTQCLALAFDEIGSRLIAALRTKELCYWNTPSGTVDTRFKWMDASIEGRDIMIPRTPNAVRIAIEQGMMAVVYRSMPVQLYSLERQRPSGVCIRPATKHGNAGHHIHSVVLNPNAEYPLIAVSYWDSIVYLFDITTQKILAEVNAELPTMAASPDGKSLAGSDSTGSIQVYDFETLQLLYRITVRDDPVTALAFTTDSLRMLEIRGMQTNVWEPSVLVSRDSGSTASSDQTLVGQVSHLAIEPGALSVEQDATITAVRCCSSNVRAFVGRNNGHVDTCELTSPATTMKPLYKHRVSSTSISQIDWCDSSGVLVSADSSSRFRAMHIKIPSPSGTEAESEVTCLLDEQLGHGSPINQLLLSPDGKYLLVSSLHSDQLWNLDTRHKVKLLERTDREHFKWFKHSTEDWNLVLYQDGGIICYDWDGLEEVASSASPYGHDSSVDLESMALDPRRDALVFRRNMTQSHKTSGSERSSQLCIIELSAIAPTNSRLSTEDPLSKPTVFAEIPDLNLIVGLVRFYASFSLVYISSSGWVCSIELSDEVPESFQRHFIIPSLWLSRNQVMISTVLEDHSVLLVHDDQLVLIEGGIHNVEDVSF